MTMFARNDCSRWRLPRSTLSNEPRFPVTKQKFMDFRRKYAVILCCPGVRTASCKHAEPNWIKAQQTPLFSTMLRPRSLAPSQTRKNQISSCWMSDDLGSREQKSKKKSKAIRATARRRRHRQRRLCGGRREGRRQVFFVDLSIGL